MAATAIIDWCAAFYIPTGFMSDGPAHFKNDTLRLLAEGLEVPHHFALPYCPWSNGAVERLGNKLFDVSRAMLSELQRRPDEWPQIVPLFQFALNTAPPSRQKNVAPITAFTGRPLFVCSSDAIPVATPQAVLESTASVDKLVRFMDDLCPIVHMRLAMERERSRNAIGKGELPNFTESDYALVAREELFKSEKICLRWPGPRRVTYAQSKYVFRVEDLRSRNVGDVQGTRLKFYRDVDLDEKAISSHFLSFETNMSAARLLRLAERDEGLFRR